MRILIALALLTSPAAAWEAVPGPICLLTHEEPGAAVRVSYDPTGPIYAITVTGAEPWADSTLFGIRFTGPAGLTITTNRHQIDGASLTVSDSGFGNVLNGLQYNATATAMLGGQSVTVSLDGAAPEVKKFRACTQAPVA